MSRYLSARVRFSNQQVNNSFKSSPAWHSFCTKSQNAPVQVEHLNTSLLPEIRLNVPPGRKVERSPWKIRGKDGEQMQKTILRDCSHFLRNKVLAKYTAVNDTSRDTSSLPKLVLLEGQSGVGKSAILQQTVARARAQGVIVLFIPNATTWTSGGGFFTPAALGDAEPSLVGLSAVRFYDRPQEIDHMFKSLLEAHRADLEKLECHPELANDETRNCSTLLDLVLLGNSLIDDIDSNWRVIPERAGSVFSHLVEELCSCTKQPTAIVIDNYEGMIGLTCMINEHKERLHANAIRAVSEHFGRNVIEGTASRMKNGFVLLATDSDTQLPSWRSSRVRSGVDYPLNEDVLRDPSGEQWLSTLKDRLENSGKDVRIRVPDLSQQELKTMRSNFLGGEGRREDGGSGEKMQRLIALAGGRGDDLQKILASN